MINDLIEIANLLDEKGLTKEADLLEQIAHDLMKEAAKKEKKWIQKAVPESKEGKFEAWCKKNGFEQGVCQSCINKAIAAGGNPAKMANFAINVSKGKYKHPGKKKK